MATDKKPKSIKKFSLRMILVFLGVIALFLSFRLADIYFVSKKTDDESYLKNIFHQEHRPNSLNILLLGLDADNKKLRARTDVIVFASFNFDDNVLNLLNIPRDTYLSSMPYKRINAANAFGGIEATKMAVEKLTNMNVDKFIILNIDSLKNIINSFTPVKLLVPKRMYYIDKSAGLKIDLHPGLQTLNADQAIQFLRYRDAIDGDIGRIKRQQIFLRAFVKQHSAIEIVKKIYDSQNDNNFGQRLLQTDISYLEAKNILDQFYMKNNLEMKTFSAPGSFGQEGFWLVDRIKLSSIIEGIKKGNTR